MPNQFTIYKSTDGSAPVLSGTAGSLVALLDACLVNGYGSKAAAGWSKAFSGTNKAAYRAPNGARLYYRVQDDGAGTGGAKEALLRGGEVMTDVDTISTGPFPTNAQSALTSNSVVIRKSTTADATARAWVVIADARTVYVLVLTADTASVYLTASFGEFFSLVPSDIYNGYVIGRTTENSGVTSADNLTDLSAGMNASLLGHFFARGHTGVGGSVNFNKVSSYAMQGTILGFAGGHAFFPNPADGAAFFFPCWVIDPVTAPNYVVRGRMRGIWVWGHVVTSLNDQDTISGTGTFAGKTFLFLKLVRCNTAGSDQVLTVETSATLETN